LIEGTGAITKIGPGNLTLTGKSTYSGGTIVDSGILLANNTRGSCTGKGNVQVNGGTLGGSGTISGNVIVGTGSGAGAILGPGARGVTPGTLTIKRNLTLKADATYRVTLDSSFPAFDAVLANGVNIDGAQIVFDDRSNSVLSPGVVFTAIDNTAGTSIAGPFANLPHGSTVTVGKNTFQANYKGGDGNDLTLRVVSN
jgi:fibronectin-binding autotransporter adhesin